MNRKYRKKNVAEVDAALIEQIAVSIEELHVGDHIKISTHHWLNHPFLKSEFIINSRDQINALKDYGITDVIRFSSHSALNKKSHNETEGTTRPSFRLSSSDEKKARIKAFVDNYWNGHKEITKKLHDLASLSRQIEDAVFKKNSIPLHTFGHFYQDTAPLLKTSSQLIVSGINIHNESDATRLHCANVSILTGLLGHNLGWEDQEVSDAMLAALLHDVGGELVGGAKVMRRRRARTHAMEQAYRMHPKKGAGVLAQTGAFSANVIAGVLQHHERMDGSGWPGKLMGDSIHKYARAICITNDYDLMVNSFDVQLCESPHTVLATMFYRFREYYDAQFLATFIRTLGVYPAGSFVQTADARVGMVIASATDNTSANPQLLFYDAEIARDQALPCSLSESGTTISRALAPSEVPEAVRIYLLPSHVLGYYPTT